MTIRSFRHILETLNRHQVEFAVVGGVAAVLHGAPVTTFDLDALIRVTEENAQRLLSVFVELDARYREHSDLIRPTREDILAGGHLLLMTNAGPLDLLGFIGRRSSFEDLQPAITRIQVAELSVPILNLDELIRQKKTLARAKDEPAIRLLEEIARRQASRFTE